MVFMCVHSDMGHYAHRFIDGSFLPGRLGNQQQRYAVAEKHFRNEMQRIRNVGRDIIKYLEKQVDPRMPP